MCDSQQKTPAPWYAQGLHFECVGCGRCCRRQGAVYLTEEELVAIARRLNQDVEGFRRRWTTNRWGGCSLGDRPDGSCVLLRQSGGCACYDLRPVRCATWPFWPEVLASPQRWEREAKTCPGMNYGDLWTQDQIEQELKRTQKADQRRKETR